MIERKIIAQKIKEFQIEEFISNSLKNVGHSHTKMQLTPLGEKIIVYASRPGLVVGRKGQNIKQLTKILKKKFNLENPQIEISEVENINLDARIVAERIASSLERFGINKFKGVGHKVMTDVMNAGALGIEIIMGGKIPSARAKRWRFYSGYLKKCGDIVLEGVDKAYARALLKTGVIGIKVSIMPPDIKLPDKIEIIEEKKEVIEEIKSQKSKISEELEKPEVSPSEEGKGGEKRGKEKKAEEKVEAEEEKKKKSDKIKEER